MKDSTELRIEVPVDLVAVLDAVSCARRITRNQLVVRILSDWAEEKLHECMLLERVARGNPALSEKIGKGATS